MIIFFVISKESSVSKFRSNRNSLFFFEKEKIEDMLHVFFLILFSSSVKTRAVICYNVKLFL